MDVAKVILCMVHSSKYAAQYPYGKDLQKESVVLILAEKKIKLGSQYQN